MPSLSERAVSLKRRINAGETVLGVSAPVTSDTAALRAILDGGGLRLPVRRQPAQPLQTRRPWSPSARRPVSSTCRSISASSTPATPT